LKIELTTYTPGELASKLKIQPGTLRKYSQLLETKGVSFERDSQDHRIYYENDYQNFYYLCELRRRNTPVDKAITQIAELYLQNLTTLQTATTQQSDDSQAEIIRVLQKELEEARNERKETNELLYQIVAELRATREQVAAIQEKQLQAPIVNLLPTPEEQTEQPKKWWQRLLK